MRGDGGRAWAYFAITSKGDTLSVHFYGVCGQYGEILCDDGIASTVFEGSPAVVFVDWGDRLVRYVLQRDGSVLHVAGCGQNLEAAPGVSGCGYDPSDFVRR